MYYIGIDVSKYKHDCCVLSNSKDGIIAQFTFSNDANGFNELLKYLDSFNESNNIRICFESTAHYTLNLKLALEKANYSFMEVNPILISKFIKSHSLRKTKTDVCDSLSIAQWLLTAEYKPHPKNFYYSYSLKSLTRLRESLVKQRSLFLVKITNVLDHIFPEYKPFFNNKLTPTSIFIISNFLNATNIANLSDEDYKKIRSFSKGKFNTIKFIELKRIASTTIGETNQFFDSQLQILLNLYNNINAQVEDLEEKIIKYINDINPNFLSIPGIGEISAAIIYSEFGDISKFDSPAKMLSFAGLDPGYYQSGTTDYNGKMVKHGSSYLRYALMNVCIPLVLNNPCFAKYYEKKKSEGKHFNVIRSHIVKKLLRVIYTLEKHNIKYNQQKLV
ncbi:MAG: IS110 family transposase [Clostridia bacterium]|nr:IS110 family transposase [Clostridia bacterium]